MSQICSWNSAVDGSYTNSAVVVAMLLPPVRWVASYEFRFPQGPRLGHHGRVTMSSQDILKALGQLQDATAELRHVIKEAHSARKDRLAAVKQQREVITKAIDEEVTR